MALTILQINIRNWKSNRYNFEVDIHNYSPDVILLNETCTTNNDIKLRGYKVSQYCDQRNSGGPAPAGVQERIPMRTSELSKEAGLKILRTKIRKA